MPVTRPYFRTCRQLADGSYRGNGHGRYVSDHRFAISGPQYVRAFLLIQKDLLEIFDYVEPSDQNLNCYSYRIHELHMRACIEVEAHCKAILTENQYVNPNKAPEWWNIRDYWKLNSTHRLSSYEIRMPLWHGSTNILKPFDAWNAGPILPWYLAYNDAKHDRHNNFPKSNFEALIGAVSGLTALLSAQFNTFDFQPSVLGTEYGAPDEGFETAIGGYFHVKFPNDWPADDRYSFDWETLRTEPNPFQALTF